MYRDTRAGTAMNFEGFSLAYLPGGAIFTRILNEVICVAVFTLTKKKSGGCLCNKEWRSPIYSIIAEKRW